MWGKIRDRLGGKIRDRLEGDAIYHCMTRPVNGEFLFEDRDKEVLRRRERLGTGSKIRHPTCSVYTEVCENATVESLWK